MQQISWAKLFVCLKELPNPHRAAPGTCFGSAYGTSPHPPGGSTSSCFSRRPAATPLDTSGDPSQRLAQGSPHVQGSSYPHPLLRYRVVMTHTLGVTPPLSLMPKTIFDLLPALLKLWQAGWSRTLGGKPRESPGTVASVTGCKKNNRATIYMLSPNICCNELKQDSWGLLYTYQLPHTHLPAEFICRICHFKGSACQRILITLIFRVYCTDMHPSQLQSLVNFESININWVLPSSTWELPFLIPLNKME